MDCIVAEDDSLDSGRKGGKEDADVSSEFKVSEEGEEFLPVWGEGFSHFWLKIF